MSCYKKIVSVCLNLWQLFIFQPFFEGVEEEKLRTHTHTHKKKKMRSGWNCSVMIENNQETSTSSDQYSLLVPVGENHEKVKISFQFILRISSVLYSLKSFEAMCYFGQMWENFLAQRNFLVSKFIWRKRKWYIFFFFNIDFFLLQLAY